MFQKLVESLSLDTKKKTRNELDDYVHIGVLQAVIIAMQSVSPGMETLLLMSGKKAGKMMSIGSSSSLSEALEKAEKKFRELRIGIIESENIKEDEVVVKVRECMMCSNLANVGRPLCYIVGGILSGFIENEIKTGVQVYENKCVTMGYDYCEFIIKISH